MAGTATFSSTPVDDNVILLGTAFAGGGGGGPGSHKTKIVKFFSKLLPLASVDLIHTVCHVCSDVSGYVVILNVFVPVN